MSVGLLERGRLPEEGGKLAGQRHGDDAGRLAALEAEPPPAAVEAALGAPGDGADARILAGLTGGERRSQVGAVPRVVSGLDEQPPRVLGARLRDPALPALLVGGVLGGDDAQVAGEQAR